MSARPTPRTSCIPIIRRTGRLVYDSIHLTVGPVTAYCLGWLDELPQADQEGLDEFERTCIAGFSYEDPVFEVDTGKH